MTVAISIVVKIRWFIGDTGLIMRQQPGQNQPPCHTWRAYGSYTSLNIAHVQAQKLLLNGPYIASIYGEIALVN
jgi:hypothetical protein